MFTVGVDPVSCRLSLFFFPPAILPVWFGWFSNTPVNPTHRATSSATSGRRAGTLCGVAHLAVHCVGALLHWSCQNTDIFFLFFSDGVFFFPLLNVTLEGAGARGSLTPVWIYPFGLHLRVLRFGLFGGGDASLVLRL